MARILIMTDKFLLIYLGAIGIGGAVIIWIAKSRITNVEEKRKSSIKRLRYFDAIKTKTPLKKPLKEARETALEGVETRFSIIKKVINITLFLIWFIALIFPFLHKIPATIVSVFVGAAGVIVGVAARPFIENMISGIVISFSHPVRVGDTVIIEGNYGTVEDISVTHTIIKIWDWRRYILPNSLMLSKEFINCTISDTYQWVHVEFWVDYNANMEAVRKVAHRAASESKFFANYEPPRFWVMEMGKEGIKCWVAAWADNPTDAWQLSHEIRTNLILALRSLGIKTHQYELHGNNP